jgi:hypothetical protein
MRRIEGLRGILALGLQPVSSVLEEICMKSSLSARRRKLLRELARVNRQIAKTHKCLAGIQGRIVLLDQNRTKAA